MTRRPSLSVCKSAEAYRGEKPFASEVLSRIGSTAGLGLYRTSGPLFYLDPPAPLPEFDRPVDLANAVGTGKIQWVIVRRRDMYSIGVQMQIVATEASYPWESDYQRRNKVLLVRLGPSATVAGEAY